MKTAMQLILSVTALVLWAFVPGTYAQALEAGPPPTNPSAAEVPQLPELTATERPRLNRERHNSSIVAVGRDATLPRDGRSDAVVAVGGSATSEGEVSEAVVSILGNTRVTGPVGESAVAVLGNTYVNSHVGEDVVAVFGNVELGPEAIVEGDVVAVGGTLTRDPQAIVDGQINSVLMGKSLSGFNGLHSWMRECALYGRLLAFNGNLGWAWGIALAFLALYVIIALLFRRGIDDCVRTMRTRPGQSALAGLLTLLGIPLLMLILAITVVGVIAIPFVGMGLFFASLFGRAVMLAWIGGGCLALVRPRDESDANNVLAHPALAVLLGGAIVLLLYTVPVLGIILYKLLGVLGLGAVVFTMILAARSARAARRAAAPAVTVARAAVDQAVDPVSVPPPGVAPAPVASTELLSLPHAGFWVRVAALAIDGLLIAMVISLLDGPFRLVLLALVMYGAVLWKLRGTTIGGSILGIKLVRIDGRDIDWATAIVRALSCLLSLVALGLGFVWIAFNDERQAWHDRIAGTLVVRVPKGVPLL